MNPAHTHPVSAASPRGGPTDEALWAPTLALTAPATRIVGDEEEYLGNAAHDVGRRIGAGRHELFVVCAPAAALVQQFEHLGPEFMVVHDVSGNASARLLQCVATAAGGRVQQLVIRRQGFGDALATLAFVELPGPRGRPGPRVYSSQVEASDPTHRAALAGVLLAHSRLAALLVEASTPDANVPALAWLRDAINADAWHNRHLLWLPLGAAAARAPAGLLGHRRGVDLHMAPTLAGVANAWPVIIDLWHQVRSGNVTGVAQPPANPDAPPHAAAAMPGPASTAPTWPAIGPAPAAAPEPRAAPPLPLRPMPALTGAATTVAAATADAAPWTHYVRNCTEIKGLVSCCVFELTTQRTLAHAGARPGPASLAAHGAALCESLLATARALGLGAGCPDLAVTFDDHHLILHPLPRHPGLVLHAVLDAHVANLTLARMKLQRIEPPATPG